MVTARQMVRVASCEGNLLCRAVSSGTEGHYGMLDGTLYFELGAVRAPVPSLLCVEILSTMKATIDQVYPNEYCEFYEA